MKGWKRRLYEGYVSSGQAGNPGGTKGLGGPYLDKLIKGHLSPSRDITILDLACGQGALIDALKRHGYRHISGVDLSPEQVAAAHARGIAEVECQDLNVFLRDSAAGAYDVVFLMDILEHLDKQEVFDVLDGVHAALADNGVAIMHVPNAAGVFGMRARYGDFTHEVAFTPRSMRQILHACAFDRVVCYEHKPTIHGLRSLVRYALWEVLTAPFRLLLIAETGTTRHILSQNMLVVARKRASHTSGRASR